MSENPVLNHIQSLVDGNDVVLFMKGNAKFPMCGFSGMVVEVLKRLDVTYQDVDVMQDQDIRQGIKDFTNWPTIPQLYIKGEFVGGADIIKEMYQSGDLKTFLEEKGL